MFPCACGVTCVHRPDSGVTEARSEDSVGVTRTVPGREALAGHAVGYAVVYGFAVFNDGPFVSAEVPTMFYADAPGTDSSMTTLF